MLFQLATQVVAPLTFSAGVLVAIRRSPHLSVRVAQSARLLAALMVAVSLYSVLESVLVGVSLDAGARPERRPSSGEQPERTSSSLLAVSGAGETGPLSLLLSLTPSTATFVSSSSTRPPNSTATPSGSPEQPHTEGSLPHRTVVEWCDAALRSLISVASSLIAHNPLVFHLALFAGLTVWIHLLISLASVHIAVASGASQSLLINPSFAVLVVAQGAVMLALGLKAFSLMVLSMKVFYIRLWMATCCLFALQHLSLVLAIRILAFHASHPSLRSRTAVTTSLISLQPITAATAVPLGAIHNASCLLGFLLSFALRAASPLALLVSTAAFLLLLEPPNFTNTLVPPAAAVSAKATNALSVLPALFSAPGPFVFPESLLSSPSAQASSARRGRLQLSFVRTHPYLILGYAAVFAVLWSDEVTRHYSLARWQSTVAILLGRSSFSLEVLFVLALAFIHFAAYPLLLASMRWSGGYGFILLPSSAPPTEQPAAATSDDSESSDEDSAPIADRSRAASRRPKNIHGRDASTRHTRDSSKLHKRRHVKATEGARYAGLAPEESSAKVSVATRLAFLARSLLQSAQQSRFQAHGLLHLAVHAWPAWTVWTAGCALAGVAVYLLIAHRFVLLGALVSALYHALVLRGIQFHQRSFKQLEL